jgi:hypothetical protein
MHPYQAAAVMLRRAAPPHPFAGLQPAHYCAIAVDPPSHSRKPDEFYARVERNCDGPYVDLFAREHPLRGRPISEQRSGEAQVRRRGPSRRVVDLLSPDP